MGDSSSGEAIRLFSELVHYYHVRGKDDIADLCKEALQLTKEYYGFSRGATKQKVATIKFA